MRTSHSVLSLLSFILFSFLFSVVVFAKESTLPRGTLMFNAEDANQEGNTTIWDFKAERWGMYEVRLAYEATVETSATITLGDNKFGDTLPPGTNRIENLGARYLAGQGKQSIEVFTDARVKYILLQPTFENADEGEEGAKGTVLQGEDGHVLLDASDALTHAVKMRYEPKSVKRCLGYWVQKDDWAEWSFELKDAGTFVIEFTQGCGKGSGGSQVHLQVDDQDPIAFEIEDTGGWQNWKTRNLGELKLEAGVHRLMAKPQTLSRGAVMDIHKIKLVRQ